MNMDREQEPLDQDTGLDGDSEQGWYFDLPKGAWERQEQKNRELRDRVLHNIQSEPDRADPFAARRTSPQQQPEEKGRGGRFGLSRRKAEPEKPKETPGGTWRLNRGGASFDNLRPVGGSLAEDPDDYSTEPPVDVQPIPLRLRSREHIGDDGRPPLQLPDSAPDDDAKRPQSRWDDAFASPAEGGMVQGMASWAKGAGTDKPDDDQPRPRRVLRAVPNEVPAKLNDDDTPAAQAADTDAPLAEDEADLPTAEAPHSPWDAAVTAPVEEPAAPEPVVEEPAPAFELKLRRRSDDEPETETSSEPDADAPRSRWDEVFSAPAGDAGMLESMRAWASKPAGEEEPAPRRMLADPDDEQLDHDIVSGHASLKDASADLSKPKKRGLFGRMFGRKPEEPRTPEPAVDTMAWLPPAHDDDAAETTASTDLPEWVTRGEDDWEEHESSIAPSVVAEEPPVAAAGEEDSAFDAEPAEAIVEDSDHGGWEPVPSAEDEPQPAWMRTEATDEEPEPAWLRTEATDEEPGAPWMLPAPGVEPEDEPLLAGHASVIDPAVDVPASPKKKGLFGRMFGRKEHAPDSSAGVVDEALDATPATNSFVWEAPAATDDRPWLTREDSDWEEPEALATPAAVSDEPPVAPSEQDVAGFEQEPAEAVAEPFGQGAWTPSEAPEAEPETPWMLHAPGEEPEDEPFVAGHASVIEPAGDIAGAPHKKGLFGRMFGHTEHDPESSAHVAGTPPDAEADHPWLTRDDSDQDETGGAAAPASAWEVPSTWSAQAASRWEPAEPVTIEPVAVDQDSQEPTAVAPEADGQDDDFSWDPEPFEPAEAAPLATVAFPEAVEYSTETPEAAFAVETDAQAGIPSLPADARDDGDWAARESSDEPADHVVVEEAPPAAIVEADPLAAWEPEEAPAEPAPAAIEEPDFASALFGHEPEPAENEEPWQAVASSEMPPAADAPMAPVAESPSWDASQPEAEAPQPIAETEEATPQGSYDDPWANFDLTADRTDAPAPASAELTPAPPAGKPEDLADDPWASFMESRQPETSTTPGERAPAVPAAESDDPWATIADASGYDPTAPIGLDSYRRTTVARQEGTESLPDWARGGDDDDTILKAFEAHANAELDDQPPAAFGDSPEDHGEPPAFEDLLGEGGNELVSEVTDAESDHNAFSRLQGWAPQKNLAPGEVGAIAHWTAPPNPSKGTPGGAEWSFEDDDDDQPPWVLPRTSDESGPVAVAVRRGSRARTLIRELVETGLLALLVFLAVRASFQNFKVDGSSMFPTLENGQFLIVNKLVYSEVDMDKLSTFVPFIDPGDSPQRNVFHGPERGDIVVLRDPRKPDTDLIKRVIGLPGETVEIVNDEQNGAQVYINDLLLQEPYIKARWHDSKPKVEIPEGYYFVMGDNRDYSLDSRSQQVGVVAKDNIIGKAMLSYWPKDKLGFAPNEAGNISVKDGRPQLTAQRIGQ